MDKTIQIPSPYQFLSETAQKRTFIALLLLTLILMISLQLLDSPLKNKIAPLGIVSFEFAGDLNNAKAIIDSWGGKGLIYAGLNTGLDYLFIFAYSSTIALGCLLVTQMIAQKLSKQSTIFYQILYQIGIVLAWGQFIAAISDSVENYALIQLLLGATQKIYPKAALYCAIPKFIIVALGISYFFVVGILIRFKESNQN
ncbi:MAG: hypothetical protein HQK72_07380 [Desulfamplus sp.]|nr:hypothetical protein [Desulfamplus sp.]